MSFQPPNEAELAAVERLKTSLAAHHENHKFSDIAILRFLRGRKGDEEKAFKALNRHLEWREEHDVDNIHSHVHTFDVELKSNKVTVHGNDRNGRPAVFIYARRHNKHARDMDQITKLIIYTLEDILKKTNPQEERMIICFDLTGFTLNSMDYDALKMLINILQFNYPDVLETAYVIGAPFIFWACWTIIKHWIDPVTVSKVQFVKKEQVLDILPPESIPHDFHT